MNYNSYYPGTNLNAFVKCYWTLEAVKESSSEKQTIVPDGCIEMIFHYGDLYRQYTDTKTSFLQPRCFVFGQITTPLEIEPTGNSGIFAARFLPDGFMHFISLPAEEIANKATALSVLFGSESSVLEQKILSAQTTEKRIDIIETFLIERLQTNEATDRIAKSGVDILFQSKGQISIEDLTKKLGINRRQLERRFSSVIGLSPKQLIKIIRLQATIKQLEKKQFDSLTSLAYENGYYDQAHFIKDFKEFTGVSPRRFYAGNLKLTSFFIGTE